MAVVVYQCDVCKREVQRKQNKRGLDVVGRCVITDGCKGKLNLVEVKPNHAIGRATPAVLGLEDWNPRKVVYTYHQEFLKKRWEVEHLLNNQPAVTTYVYHGDKLERAEPIVEYTTNNSITLTFPTAVQGITQCVARSASDGQNITSLNPNIQIVNNSGTFDINSAMQLTTGSIPGEITVATKVRDIRGVGFDVNEAVTIKLQFLSPVDLEPVPDWSTDLTLRELGSTPVDLISSPWGGSTYAIIHGHKYLLRSVNIHEALGNLSSRGIPPGAAFYFESVSHGSTTRPFNERETYILLADAPYSRNDRVYDKLVDIVDLGKQHATANTAYIDSELLITPTLLETIFPSIILR